MSELTERLRAGGCGTGCDADCKEAADEIERLTKQRDELLASVTRCYRMLLSEPDTKGALFKAENILREAIANAEGKAMYFDPRGKWVE